MEVSFRPSFLLSLFVGVFAGLGRVDVWKIVRSLEVTGRMIRQQLCCDSRWRFLKSEPFLTYSERFKFLNQFPVEFARGFQGMGIREKSLPRLSGLVVEIDNARQNKEQEIQAEVTKISKAPYSTI